MKKMMPETIEWRKNRVWILDQTRLPFKKKYIVCSGYKRVARAIKVMEIRGAPAIGIAGVMGLALGVLGIKTGDKKLFFKRMNEIAEELIKTRPTGYNLQWMVNRALKVASLNKVRTIPQIKKIIVAEACRIRREDVEMNKKIGNYGAGLIKKAGNLLTHCNAGALATGGYGTALGVIRSAYRQGKVKKVFVDETRPRLQGARLTAYEMVSEKIPAVLISDSMAGCLMGKKQVNAVVVGADRIAANGDTANKIGTYPLAVLARYHRVPFYVAAPCSTIDFNITSGKAIVVEERESSEVLKVNGLPITCPGIRVFNPSFDVTPRNLITAIITEKGVVRNPCKKNMERLKC